MTEPKRSGAQPLVTVFFVYDYLNKNLPNSYVDTFTRFDEPNATSNTRQTATGILRKPRYFSTFFGLKSIYNICILSWNNLTMRLIKPIKLNLSTKCVVQILIFSTYHAANSKKQSRNISLQHIQINLYLSLSSCKLAQLSSQVLPATLHGSAYFFFSALLWHPPRPRPPLYIIPIFFFFFACCFNKNKSTHSPDIFLTGAGFLEQVSCVFPACPNTPSSKFTVHILADYSISIQFKSCNLSHRNLACMSHACAQFL